MATAARVAPNEAVAQASIYLAQIGAARASLKKRRPREGARLRFARAARRVRALGVLLGELASREQRVPDRREDGPTVAWHAASVPESQRPARATAGRAAHLAPIQSDFPAAQTIHVRWVEGIGAAQTIEVGTQYPLRERARGTLHRRRGGRAGRRDAGFRQQPASLGGKPSVNVSGAALVAEFRTQRALDFYLTGQRLGDLRRYAAAGTDLFPTGKHPVRPSRTARCTASSSREARRQEPELLTAVSKSTTQRLLRCRLHASKRGTSCQIA